MHPPTPVLILVFLCLWCALCRYGRWGLMVGSVFSALARDVADEGWEEEGRAMAAVTQV